MPLLLVLICSATEFAATGWRRKFFEGVSCDGSISRFTVAYGSQENDGGRDGDMSDQP